MMSGLSYQQNIDIEKYFSIGLTPSVSRAYATKLLSPLLENEAIGLKTVEGSIEDLIGKLYSHDLDFLLTETHKEYLVGKGIETHQIKTPKYCVVAGKKFKNKNAKFPEDFNGAPYFKYDSGNAIQRDIDRYFHDQGILPKVVGESDDLSIMIAATELNHCFSIVPDISVAKSIQDKRLTFLGQFEVEKAGLCALYLDDNSNEKIKNMVESINKQF
jgi:LysR family transcriptional activator of nhaA